MRKKKKENTYEKQKMFAPKCDIFITYRFTRGKACAKYLYNRLKSKGYWVCLDFENPNNEEHKYIFSCLDKAKDFLLILPPHALDFGKYNDDTEFQEKIERAIKSKVNIIPIELENFEWPESKNFPESLRDILEFESIPMNQHFWEQAIIKLTKKNSKSKKRFLKSRTHLNRKIYYIIFICAMLAISSSLYYRYVKSIPIFFLDLSNNTQLQSNLESRYKHWDKCYVITNTGRKTGDISVNPTAMIEIIVECETEGSSGRMGSIIIGIENYFKQTYHITEKPFNSVGISETKAHLTAEYLSEIIDSLRNRNYFLIMYTMKIHFLISYRDMFGLKHNYILEPDFDYDFSYTAVDKKNKTYLLPRAVGDTTLYKRKSVIKPYIMAKIINDGQIVPTAEQIAQTIENNKEQLLDKDCNFTINDDGCKTFDPYYIFNICVVKENDDDNGTLMFHAEHNDCVLLSDN